ncbi:MAG: hypothetical protein M3Z75_17530 [Actinomycetota bacterium]|nr:hypothetical protein [Actinomycetota bacterium]
MPDLVDRAVKGDDGERGIAADLCHPAVSSRVGDRRRFLVMTLGGGCDGLVLAPVASVSGWSS